MLTEQRAAYHPPRGGTLTSDGYYACEFSTSSGGNIASTVEAVSIPNRVDRGGSRYHYFEEKYEIPNNTGKIHIEVGVSAYTEAKANRPLVSGDAGDLIFTSTTRLPGVGFIAHGIVYDFLSSPDERAEVSFWKEFVRKHWIVLLRLGKEFGIDTGAIHWEYPDVAGAQLLTALKTTITADPRVVEKFERATILFSAAQAQRKTDGYAIELIIKKFLFDEISQCAALQTTSLHDQLELLWSNFVQRLAKRTSVDVSIFYWYLNGVFSSQAVIIPEIDLGTRTHAIFSAIHHSNADTWFAARMHRRVKYFGNNELSQNLYDGGGSDRNQWIDKLLALVQRSVSPQVLYQLLLEKPHFGPYQVLNPYRFGFQKNSALITDSKTIPSTVTVTELPPGAELVFALGSDGFTNPTRDLDRSEAANDIISHVMQPSKEMSVDELRQMLDVAGCTTDDRSLQVIRVTSKL